MNENEMVKARWSHLRAAYKADLPALTVARAREFLREYPDCGPAWKILGEALVDLARHSEAEHALEQAIAKCPLDKLWIPLAEMGHLHRARGEYKAAVAWYRRAIDTMPDEASGHIYIGGVLAKSGRLKEAETAHRAAIRCTQGCRDEAYLNLGLVLRAQERYDEAATCFEQALKLDPKYVAARKALRDVRNTMRFSKELRREEAARLASELATAGSRSGSGEEEPVAS
ncbi:MAG: tetratricopeptide repeat protein [Isosphaeraceae bacterium]